MFFNGVQLRFTFEGGRWHLYMQKSPFASIIIEIVSLKHWDKRDFNRVKKTAPFAKLYQNTGILTFN